jgi:hypothetical protein
MLQDFLLQLIPIQTRQVVGEAVFPEHGGHLSLTHIHTYATIPWVEGCATLGYRV